MTNTENTTPSELPILTLLERVVRSTQVELVERLTAAGVSPITPAHTTVLAHLDDGSSESVAELARRAGVTRQTMHQAVSQLIDEGLLTSRPGAGFPRSTLIEYSEAGRRRRAIAMDVLRQFDDVVAARLGHDDARRLRAALTDG